MSTRKLTIEEVEKKFAIWRSNKQGHPKIPEALWAHIKVLMRTHEISKVLGRLGVTRRQAKNRRLLPAEVVIEDNTKRKSLSPFIKIPPQVIPKLHERHSKLTLRRGDVQLSLDDPSDQQIQLLVNTFLR